MGRVSFEDEDADEVVYVGVPPSTGKKEENKSPIYIRPSGSRGSQRGVRGISSIQPQSAIDLQAVKDLYPEKEALDNDYEEASTNEENLYREFDEINLARRVAEAKIYREARRTEGLLEDYVSLETVTQEWLDPEEKNFINRSNGTKSRNNNLRKVSMWEDIEEEEERPTIEEGDESEDEVRSVLDEDDFNDERIKNDLNNDEKNESSVNQFKKFCKIETEEERLWELQQIGKGVLSGHRISRKTVAATAAIKKSHNLLNSQRKQLSLQSSIPTFISTLNASITNTQSKLSELQVNLDAIKLTEAESIARIEENEEKLKRSDGESKFYIQINEVIQEYAEMLDFVIPKLEEAEELQFTALRNSPKQFMNISSIFQEDNEDINLDYSSPKMLLSLLAQWKQLYPITYEQSFINLCIPTLLEVYFRNYILQWNPINNESTQLDTFINEMFNEMFESFMELEERAGLESKIMTIYLAPRLIKKISLSFDPVDPSSYRTFVDSFKFMEEKIGSTSFKILTSFKSTIFGIIEECISSNLCSSKDTLLLLKEGLSLIEMIDPSFYELTCQKINCNTLV